ncbi:hypothetical protein ABZ137_35505 [Streptomyces bobili]
MDEYGNPRVSRTATRHGGLGAKQRSSETLTGLTAMGARLCNPAEWQVPHQGPG